MQKIYKIPKKKKSVGVQILSRDKKGALVAILQVRSQWNEEKNSPESYPGTCQVTVHGKLEEGEDFIHQFTFGNYVYDFAFPKYRELLEVHGDWWHANPAKYPHDPKTKMQWIDGTLGASDFKEKSLHLIQIKNIERDKKKWVFALENGWKCGFVWESDVCNTHNLKGIINGVKRTLQKTQ